MIIETTEKITLDNLTENSVSVLTQQFAEINGQTVQIGTNHRASYINSTYGRIELEAKLAEPYLSSVMAVWGEKPIIEEQIGFEETIETEEATETEEQIEVAE